jgi:glycyl-tRNA synthetase
VDFDTEPTGNVTVRNRDTMEQEVVAITDLRAYIEEKLQF